MLDGPPVVFVGVKIALVAADPENFVFSFENGVVVIVATKRTEFCGSPPGAIESVDSLEPVPGDGPDVPVARLGDLG